MNEESLYPRMTFLMITYNQEKYIREALESALAQDYEDLEIVVCDDVSKDRTFEIATEIANAYKGPHKVILHRNEHNLGIAANFHKAYTLSSGKWLFMAAGDDVFLPNRCRVVAEAARKYPEVRAFFTNFDRIDGDGRHVGFSSPDNLFPVGASVCWHREVFSCFPPLSSELKLEDAPLFTRPFMLGGSFAKLPDVTLKYRRDGHSFIGIYQESGYETALFRCKITEILIRSYKSRLDDWEYLHGRQQAIPFGELLAARQQWGLDEAKKLLASYQQTLEVFSMPLMSKIMYLFKPQPLRFHSHVGERLKLFLSSFNCLVSIKRLIRKPRKVMDTIGDGMVQKLPENLKPVIIDTKFYLTHEEMDFFMPEDGHVSFRKNFMTPERQKQLDMIP